MPLGLILLLFLVMLTSMILCQQNRFCSVMIFVGYIILILFMTYAIHTLPKPESPPLVEYSPPDIQTDEFTSEHLTPEETDALDMVYTINEVTEIL